MATSPKKLKLEAPNSVGSITRSQRVDEVLANAARVRRANPTSSERRAWRILRDRGVLGLKFRREQLIGRSCADFYCAEFRICLEIDGSIHDEPSVRERDLVRTDGLILRRVRVVRIAAECVSVRRLTELLRPIVAQRPR